MAKGKRKAIIPSALAGILSTAEAEVTPPKEQKQRKEKTGQRIPMARVFIDGQIAQLTNDPVSVEKYIEGFLGLPSRGSAGYDSFISTKDGFTSSKKFRSFTAQATAKMIAVLMYRAGLIIAAGGEDADAMKNALTGINKSKDNLFKAAQQDFLQTGLRETYASLLQTLGGDHKKVRERLAQFVKDNNLTMPNAKDFTVEPAAPATTTTTPAQTVKAETGAANQTVTA